MGRPRKTPGPGKAELMWRAMEKEFTDTVRREIKDEYQEEVINLLRSLGRTGTWTGPMIGKLRVLLKALA